MAAYSICIPRVYANITWKRVKTVFEQLDLGMIDRIDMVPRTDKDGTKFQRCFVHFKTWGETDNAKAVRSQLDADGGEVKIVYDDPWFWKCFKSRVARPSQAPSSKRHKTPTIELEDGKIIRAAQRSAGRKVQGRQQQRRHQPRQPRGGAGGGNTAAAPASSISSDQFLAELSIPPVEEVTANTGPMTPPGSPNHPPMVSAMSPTSTVMDLGE